MSLKCGNVLYSMNVVSVYYVVHMVCKISGVYWGTCLWCVFNVCILCDAFIVSCACMYMCVVYIQCIAVSEICVGAYLGCMHVICA